MSGIEGFGEVVTGGMLARAVEPKAGEAVGEHGCVCLNCGATLVGEYCHRCGQAAHVHRSLHSFVHDLAHGVLHLEGKTWRTLPMLAFKPGQLTRRYIAGERAKFVSPMALFLFTVFLMFAVFHAVGGPFGGTDHIVTKSQDVAKTFQKERAKQVKQLAKAQAELNAARQAGESTSEAENDIRGIQTGIAEQDKAYQLAMAAIAKAEQAKAAEKTAKPGEGSGQGEPFQNLGDSDIKTGWSMIDRGIAHAKGNPELVLYKLQSNAYKFSWALIPISVPFVWLLFFWKRRYKLYDHTVFVTYSLAFMSFGLIVLSLLRPLGLSAAIAGLAIAFVPPFHMYRQLKGAYALGRFGALWRTFFLLIFAFIAGTFFFTLLLALGALD